MRRIDRLRSKDRKQIIPKIFIEQTLVLNVQTGIWFDRYTGFF